MADLNTISSSKYDIYTKLLDIAASNDYIVSNNDLANVDFLRTGVFGYVTESLAMILRDSAFHKTMVYRENFLNTALMPSSIYNWAKMFNINCIDAKPSTRYATISINVNVIDQIISNTSGSTAAYAVKYGVSEASNFMILDKSNPIIAGNYYFTLEHSVEIYKNPKGKYIVKYCLNEKNVTTNFGTYSDGGIINTSYVTTNSEKYLTFKVLVAQYKVVEESKIISGSTYIDTKVHQFNYSGQICGMGLKYTKGDVTEEVDLKFSNIEIESDKEAENKVAYYSIVDNDTIEISFISNKVAGLPQTGGQLTLSTFITEGFNGNIAYNGDAVFLIKQDDFKSLPISVTLSSDILTSGTDQTSLGNLKNLIVDRLSTRNTIITENDLNSWFSSQSKLLEDVSNSGITFRKEKDNLLKRSFSVYLLLRDGASLDAYMSNGSSADGIVKSAITSSYISNVVPTNTIDIVCAPSEIPSGMISGTEISLNTTQDISYDVTTQTFNIVDSNASKTTDYVFRTPFSIKLNTLYNQVSYFYLETDDSSELEFTNLNYMNDMVIIPTQVSVYHVNKIHTTDVDTYTFTFNVSSDANLREKKIKNASLYFGTDKVELDTDTLKFELADTTDEDTSEGTLVNYKLDITGIYTDIQTTIDSSRLVMNFASGDSSSTKTVQLNESSDISLMFEFEDNSFSGTMGSVGPLTYFMALDDVVSSDVVINRDASDNILSYVIKDVPVVASYWITSTINKKWFIRQLFVFINMLKANINKLETTTFFNIKFRNAYGFAHYYNSVSTQLRLGLTIYIDKDKAKATAKQMSLTTDKDEYESLKNEIRDYIRVAVDNANESGELVISKIIMQTQAAYYNFIKHIDFNGLNGTYNQYVKQIDTTNISYPLEYFSLDETLLDKTSSGYTAAPSRLEQDITFVFE